MISISSFSWQLPANLAIGTSRFYVPRQPAMRYLICLLHVIFTFFCVTTRLAVASIDAPVIGLGYGIDASGGSGGTVYIVTTLRDAGAGSLRSTIHNSKRPAMITFARCGTIELKSRLLIRGRDLTIDGGTCKSGAGIQIKNYPVTISNAKNVILTNLALRLGTDAPMLPGQFKSSDSLEISCSQDIVLDHLSIYWGTDENLSIYCYSTDKGTPTTRISVQHSIIAEGLRTPKALAPKTGSMGVLIDGAVHNVTFFGNLFVSNADRNPEIGPEGFKPSDVGTTRIQFVNNMLYNTIYGLRTGGTSSPNWSVELDIIGNLQKSSADNFSQATKAKPLYMHRTTSTQNITVYLQNNLTIHRPRLDLPDINIFRYGSKDGADGIKSAIESRTFNLSHVPFSDLTTLPMLPVSTLEASMLRNAGKIIPCRDPIDTRVIENVGNDRKHLDGGQGPVDEPSDVGGYMENTWKCPLR